MVLGTMMEGRKRLACRRRRPTLHRKGAGEERRVAEVSGARVAAKAKRVCVKQGRASRKTQAPRLNQCNTRKGWAWEEA